MECRHDRYAFVVQPLAARIRDAFAVHEEIERNGAQEDDDLRLDQFDLPSEIGQAAGGLLRFRIAVRRGAAFDDVRNVAAVFGVLRRAVEPHGVDHAGQQLSCAAHERNALLVFVLAWAFADEHDAGLPETVFHDVVSLACVKRAGLTVEDGFL